jgi:UDP-N-acetylglucosamine transferase subunit ALG13
MIPLARKLRDMNYNVFIGSGEEHLALFRNELQDVSFINFPGFKPGYSRRLPQFIFLILKIPSLLYHIVKEHCWLRKIIREYEIHIVISDNRFGLWNNKIKTVYITHLPLIPFPKPFFPLEFIGIILHRTIIKKYTLCYIPDLPGEVNLSGRLSHGIRLPSNVRYIGILSRFTRQTSPLMKPSGDHPQIVVILSGPEPQKGILKGKLIAILNDKGNSAAILEGRPGEKTEVTKSGNITFYNHLSSSEMKDIIIGSKTIITRAGYSTIMELISLNCSALIIPTFGQPEQEYLAEYLSEKGWFATIAQSRLNNTIDFPQNKTQLSALFIEKSEELLNNALKELLQE